MATNEQKRTESKYAKKFRRRTQMYGPGCCGHELTRERMDSIRRENGTFGRRGDQL